MNNWIEVGMVYHLTKENGGIILNKYFIRRPNGGYAISENVDQDNFVDYLEYWRNALDKLQEEGYVVDFNNVNIEIENYLDSRNNFYLKLKRIFFWLFLGLLLIYAIGFILEFSELRRVNNISAQVLKIPNQQESKNKDLIKFSREGYLFELTPKFEYDISGLIVHSFSYDTWYSLDKKDITIPMDFCMIWGDNIKSGIFKDKNSSFSQDMRFCWWRGKGGGFNNDEISNSHILLRDDELLAKLKSLHIGDQVRFIGKLVDFKVTPLKSGNGYSNAIRTYQTSTTRLDAGAGACEIIYLEKIEIIQKHIGFSDIMKKIALFGIPLVFVARLGAFFALGFKRNKS
jgi:hypothetical protein